MEVSKKNIACGLGISFFGGFVVGVITGYKIRKKIVSAVLD